MVLRVTRVIGLTIAFFALFFVCFSLLYSGSANAAINPEINFQGKLTNPDGTNVTNGSYSLRFRIYTSSSGDTGSPCLSTCLWEETQGSVSINDGIFRVALGSVTALPGSVDFNNSSLYLSIKVGSDPEMSPRIRFTSSPYAFNSDRLNGLSSTNFVQLAQGTQTDSSTTNASIDINKTGSTAMIFHLQRSSSTVLGINNDGSALFKNQTDSATGFQIQNLATNPLFVVNTTSGNIYIGDPTDNATGNLLVLDNKNTSSDPTGIAGATYYNSNLGKFRCFEAGFWKNCADGGAPTIAQVYDATGGTDLNTTTATAVPFDAQTRVDSGITHSTSVNNTRVQLDAAGWYKISYNVSGANQSANRNNVFCQIRFNGTTFNNPSGSYSYARDTTNAYGTNSSTVLAQTTSTNEYFEVMCSRAGTAGAQLALANQSWVSVEKVNVNSGTTLQAVYDNGNTLTTSNARDLLITATDTATDANILVNLQCVTACSTNGRFAVQNGGTDRFTVNPDGSIAIAATAASSITTSSGALTVTSGATATWGTSAGNLTLQAAGTNSVSINTGGAGAVNLGTSNSTTISLGNTSASFTAESNTSTTSLFNGATAHTIQLATGAAAQSVSIGSTNTTSSLALNAGSGNILVNATGGNVTLQTTTSGSINFVPGGSSNVVIGTSDTTGTLLVLDTKTNTGDPTGVNGGLYYNSSSGKFRCYEASSWSDCFSTRVLGETTLGSAATSITVNLSVNTEYLHCRVDVKGRSAASILYARFNSDSGTAAYGWNAIGIVATATTDWQDSSDSEIQLSGTQTGTTPISANLNITNFSDTNKVVDWTAAGVEAVGNNSNKYDGVGGYYNTSAQISSVTFLASTGNLNTGTHAWCEGRDIP